MPTTEKSRTRKTLGWGASIVGILGAVTAAVQAYSTVLDARTKAADAREKSIAGYETLEPAVRELQIEMAKSVDWAEATDDEVSTLEDYCRGLADRVSRLEGYLDATRGPASVAAYSDAEGSDPETEPVLVSEPEPLPPAPKTRARKPNTAVPDSIDTAQRIYKEEHE